MKSFIQKIIEIGIANGISRAEEKKVRMFNVLCIFWFFFALFLITKYVLFDSSPIPIISFHCFIVVAILVMFVLQHKKYHFAARITLITLQLLNVFLISNYFRPGVLAEYFCLFIPLLTVYLIGNKIVQYSSLLFSMMVFFIPNMFFNHYPDSIFGSGAAIGLFLLFFIMVKYLITLNTQNEKRLEMQKNKALEDNNIIDNQRKELEELNRFQSRFFINISHEIRTPLTLILGKSDELKEHEVTKYNPELAKTIGQIDIQSNKIRQIVDDVIDLAKMNSNQFKLNTKRVMISDFLNKLHLSFEPLFKQQQISFDYISTLESEIIADTVYLERALNNIISNALKYSTKGGNFLMTLQDEDDKHICILMEDDGIGIADNEIHKIFDRFYQADNDINKSQGSGIGLSFTKEVIELLYGKISVTSKIGVGSCFRIVLPVHSFIEAAPSKLDDQVNNSIPETKIRNTFISSSRKRLLIVDDHKDMREYLTSLLNEYLCYEAGNGTEAMGFLNENKVDLVITDYMMPVMDGYMLVKQMKEFGIEIPIMMLTARADHEGKLEVLRLGIDDYITKPFNKEELKVKVANALHNFKSKQDFILQEEVSEGDLKQKSFIREIEKFVFDRSDETGFGVEDIVNEFSISKSSLYRKIKASTGLSSNDFINEVKLQKAREIIRKNDSITLKELSYAVGFKQSNYFSKLYQKRFGVKPII